MGASDPFSSDDMEEMTIIEEVKWQNEARRRQSEIDERKQKEAEALEYAAFIAGKAVRVIPDDYRFPEVSRHSKTDRYASVRGLEKPLFLHHPHDVQGLIETVCEQCPNAQKAIKALSHADRIHAEWGKVVPARPVLLVGPPGSGKSTVARNIIGLGAFIRKPSMWPA